MGRMKDVAIDIENLLNAGMSEKDIATKTGMPIEQVREVKKYSGSGGGGGGMNPADIEKVPGKRPLKMKEGKSVPAADDDEGGRTKFIRENMKEGKMKDALMGISKMADKVGIRQDEAYKGKSKEEVMRKAKGGVVKSSASKRADGCAQRGKTKGRMV